MTYIACTVCINMLAQMFVFINQDSKKEKWRKRTVLKLVRKSSFHKYSNVFVSLAGTFLHDESCIKSCPRGTFSNTKDRRCERCSEGCEMCAENNECLKCSHDILHAGRCYKSCPE